jgi:hypothetical protein
MWGGRMQGGGRGAGTISCHQAGTRSGTPGGAAKEGQHQQLSAARASQRLTLPCTWAPQRGPEQRRAEELRRKGGGGRHLCRANSSSSSSSNSTPTPHSQAAEAANRWQQRGHTWRGGGALRGRPRRRHNAGPWCGIGRAAGRQAWLGPRSLRVWAVDGWAWDGGWGVGGGGDVGAGGGVGGGRDRGHIGRVGGCDRVVRGDRVVRCDRVDRGDVGAVGCDRGDVGAVRDHRRVGRHTGGVWREGGGDEGRRRVAEARGGGGGGGVRGGGGGRGRLKLGAG